VRQPSTGQWSVAFTVTNTGGVNDDTYSLSCTGDTHVSCDSIVISGGGGVLHATWLKYLCL
jgi:hypothetical protein